MEMVTTAEDELDMGRHSHKVRKIQAGRVDFSWLKMDAVGFGVLEFALAGLLGAGPDFALVIGGIEGGAVFAAGVGLVVAAFDFVAAFANVGVALFAENWPAAVAELAGLHF